MDLNEIKRIPIPSLLTKFNITPVKTTNKEAWYYGFQRNERTASVKVDLERNMYYDFGIGEGGSIIDLVMTLKRFREVSEAIKFLKEFAQIEPVHIDQIAPPPTPREKQLFILQEEDLSHQALLQYLEKRCIPSSIAKHYCKQITFKIRDKILFGIGFQNDRGGYEIRNHFFKTSSSPKAETKFLFGHEIVLVFEGFFDFLSFATLCPNFEIKYDVVVLNSLSNMKKITPEFWSEYLSIFAFFDNDSAGQNALEKLKSQYKNVVDFSGHYLPYNDLNEWLTNNWIARFFT